MSPFWEIMEKTTMIEDQRNIKKFPKVMNGELRMQVCLIPIPVLFTCMLHGL